MADVSKLLKEKTRHEGDLLVDSANRAVKLGEHKAGAARRTPDASSALGTRAAKLSEGTSAAKKTKLPVRLTKQAQRRIEKAAAKAAAAGTVATTIGHMAFEEEDFSDASIKAGDYGTRKVSEKIKSNREAAAGNKAEAKAVAKEEKRKSAGKDGKGRKAGKGASRETEELAAKGTKAKDLAKNGTLKTIGGATTTLSVAGRVGKATFGEEGLEDVAEDVARYGTRKGLEKLIKPKAGREGGKQAAKAEANAARKEAQAAWREARNRRATAQRAMASAKARAAGSSASAAAATAGKATAGVGAGVGNAAAAGTVALPITIIVVVSIFMLLLLMIVFGGMSSMTMLAEEAKEYAGGSSLAETAMSEYETQGPKGHNAWSRYSANPDAWCSDFVCYCWSHTEGLTDVLGNPGTSAAGSWGDWARLTDDADLGQTSSSWDPQPGDIVLVRYNGSGYADHVEIVVEGVDSSGYYTTIGGNTGNESVVGRNRFMPGQYFTHYVRPHYPESLSGKDGVHGVVDGEDVKLIKAGSSYFYMAYIEVSGVYAKSGTYDVVDSKEGGVEEAETTKKYLYHGNNDRTLWDEVIPSSIGGSDKTAYTGNMTRKAVLKVNAYLADTLNGGPSKKTHKIKVRANLAFGSNEKFFNRSEKDEFKEINAWRYYGKFYKTRAKLKVEGPNGERYQYSGEYADTVYQLVRVPYEGEVVKNTGIQGIDMTLEEEEFVKKWGKKINNFIKRNYASGALSGHGDAIALYAKREKCDPRIITAIAVAETCAGKVPSYGGKKGKHNYWSWGCYPDCEYICPDVGIWSDDIDDAIKEFCKKFAPRYGGKSPAECAALGYGEVSYINGKWGTIMAAISNTN